MDRYIENNKVHWNEITPVHERSDMYDVAGFKAGRCALKPAELREIGNDVAGKTMLHLQCHFGLDTLSWARRGAIVTGVDFSDKAVTLARQLSEETAIPADFICSDIHSLTAVLDKQFDIVFTSYGVLCWLPDLGKWAEIINHFLKPGGFFYIVEGHPVMNIFDNEPGVKALTVRWSYFNNPEWLDEKPGRDYADAAFTAQNGTSEWAHSLSEIVNALIGAGLRIDFIHESPEGFYKALPFMVQDKEGIWRIEGDKLPLTFSIKATKPSP